MVQVMNDDAPTALRRAEVLLDLGRPAAARDEAQRAAADDPSNPTAFVVLAKAHHELGVYPEAIDAAESSLRAEETIAGLHCLARAQRALGDHADALETFARAIAQAPESSLLHVGVALTHVARFEAAGTADASTAPNINDIADARAAATRAIDIDPAAPLGHYAAALAAFHGDDMPAAAQNADEALRLDAGWAEAHLLAGRIRAAQGMSRLASRHFAAAAASGTTDERPLQRLRWLNRARLGWLARRRGVVAPHVVPEARRLLEADRDLADRHFGTGR